MELKIIPKILEKRKNINDKDFLYLNFLTMQYLKENNDTALFAQDYLWETFKNKDFSKPNNHSTDFYLLLNNYLKENNLPKNTFDWVKNTIKGKHNLDYDNKFFIQLEKDLNINNLNLKALRRNITEEYIDFSNLLIECKKYDYEVNILVEGVINNVIDKIASAAKNIIKKTALSAALLIAAPILGTIHGLWKANRANKKMNEYWRK